MYKKIIITFLLVFSAFLVSDKVSAKEISQFCEYTEPCLTTEDIDTIIKNNNIDTSIHNAYLFTVAKGRFSDNSPRLTIFFFNYNDMLNNKIYINEYLSSLGALYSSNYPISIYSLHLEGNFKYDLSQEIVLNYAYHSGTPGGISHAIHFGNSTEDFYTYYTNVDILDENGNIVFPANNLSPDEEFTINFHLNGGVAVDSYQSNIEKNELIDKVKEVLEIDKMLELYPSLSGSMMDLFIEPSEDKFSKFCKDWIIDVETQYEALQYYQKLINKDYTQPITYTEDYEIKILTSDFEDYLLSQSMNDEIKHFDGWYYDENITNKFKITDVITEDIHLYAKWSYASVDDLLNDVNFKKYTFDTKYEYAIISLGNNTGDIYIGLEKTLYNLEIYEYIENSKEYIKGSTFNLVPKFLHNDINYYKLDPVRTDNINVIVLPKIKLESINNGVITTYYDFYLSENANITYTNNLGKTVIYDKDGNKIETDLKESYDYSQEILLKNDTEDSLNSFIKPIKFIISSITEFYEDFCPPIVKNFFYLSFIILIVLFIIKLIW